MYVIFDVFMFFVVNNCFVCLVSNSMSIGRVLIDCSLFSLSFAGAEPVFPHISAITFYALAFKRLILDGLEEKRFFS